MKLRISKRVLVIDDEPDLSDLLATQFDLAGIEVVTASNGKDGLAAMRQHRFDVIVTDVFMPEMNGVDFIGKVREFAVDTRILVLTGGGKFDGIDVRQRLRQMGCKVFEKPCGIKQLISEVMAICELESAKKAG